MYEETVERIARMIAEDNGDPQHWGVYATRAMEIIYMVHLSVSARATEIIDMVHLLDDIIPE